MPTPRLCNPKPFKAQFKTDVKDRRERRYCYILGAGASVRSGIPSGKELARRWLEELYERQCPVPAPGSARMPLEAWCQEPGCPVQGVDPSNPGADYPRLFRARFPGSDPEGQRFVQEQVRGPRERPNIPSIGYAYLALLLQTTDSRVVITTNFDNMAADALLQFTGSLPRVIGHERVASFAGLRDGQPLIAKIHGDVGFVTSNNPNEVATLPQEWHGPLREILRDYIPIVIGYDGNDGSLMDFLADHMTDTTGESLLRSGMYWCYRVSEGRDWQERVRQNTLLKRLVDVHQVHFVPIEDFDLWMMELGIHCDVGDPEDILKQNAARRVESLSDQLTQARGRQSLSSADPAVEASRQEARREIGRTMPAWDLAYKARQTDDPEEARRLYQQAIQQESDNPGILGGYALFLHDTYGDPEAALEAYQRAVEHDPYDADLLGNYALCVEDLDSSADDIEAAFERAVKADPFHANNLANYALFLQRYRDDPDRVEALFRRSLDAEPNRVSTLRNYGLFLQNTLQNYDKAESQYKQALSIAPGDANALGIYAEFLARVRSDYEQAESYYERAIKADPDFAMNLVDYASFQAASLGNLQRAEELFQRALAARPDNPYALVSYAEFLASERQDMSQAREYFDRALEIEPDNPLNLCSYAMHLTMAGEDPELVEPFYKLAIGAHPESAFAAGQYAVFLSDIKEDREAAEPYYERSVQLDPGNSGNHSNYAEFLAEDPARADLAADHFERALAADEHNSRAMAVYAQFLEEHGHPDRADELYSRSVEEDPDEPLTLARYALFLDRVRGDHHKAEALYRRAVEADPSNTVILTHLAGLLLRTRDDDYAHAMLHRAVREAARDRQSDLRDPESLSAALEAWFFAFVHRRPDEHNEALAELKALLVGQGTRSPGSQLEDHVRLGTERNHPASDWIGALAAVIQGRQELDDLEAWPEWAGFKAD